MAEFLMQLGEALSPMESFATGRRAQLIDAGWSAVAADQYAAAVLLELLTMTMLTLRKQMG
jgi:hypothetical protein